MKKVLLIGTGGTIASQVTHNGLAPELTTEQLLSQAARYIEAAEPLADGVKLVAAFVDADAALLRDFASRLIETPGVVALVGSENAGQANYVFGRAADVALDMGALLRDAARPLGGKGGGRPDFAQGGGCRGILEAACQLLRQKN